MNLPNKITFLRITLIPVTIIFFVYEKYLYFIIILIISFITDALDGFFARIKNQKTEIGTFLDPLADKILINSIYISFSIKNFIPWWITILIITRDLIIVTGWAIEYIMTKISIIKPSILGKMTVFFQMITLIVVFFYYKTGTTSLLIYHIITKVTIILTIVSGLHYMVAGIKRLD